MNVFDFLFLFFFPFFNLSRHRVRTRVDLDRVSFRPLLFVFMYLLRYYNIITYDRSPITNPPANPNLESRALALRIDPNSFPGGDQSGGHQRCQIGR